ncbi:DMT family transporter [Sediminimonas qiaohouensis]|uniref:DMT family transporter n=1 Tax=Sediminimonas qiaohouensis TaxID=552061 RepID=UPI00047C3DD3|nr:DMT family transporter [Sediminimonas qiaohouensis]
MIHLNHAPTLSRPVLWAVMLAVGISWGATTPLGKVAVSTGLHPIGITIWQTFITAIVLSCVVCATGRRLPVRLPYLLFFLFLGLLGTAIPHPLGYLAARHLPASIISIVLAGVPMVTMLLTALVGIDRPTPRKIVGILLGLLAIVLIVLPDGSLPDPTKWIWVALPILSVLSYSTENVCIDKIRMPRLDPMVILCGLSWAAFFLTAPLAALPGIWVNPFPLDHARLSVIVLTALHICAYSGLIWLIEKAGAVFATQVSYVVTISGVLIAIVFLGEAASPMIGIATALMLTGLTLVRPRHVQ